MNRITLQTNCRTEFIDITRAVQSFIDEQHIQSGWVTIFIPHTTAGVTINENADPDVLTDLESVLDTMVPWNNGYRHQEGNTAAHMKASMMGTSLQVIIEEGSICLGTWQSIYFCEFDGPRSRNVWLKGISACE